VADRGRQPSIYDVAKLADVSHQTVSRVVNDHPSTRPETRERVLKAMETLGYRPNRAARTLATSKSHIIGILVSDVELFGPSSMLRAMEQAAREGDYVTVSCTIDPSSESSVASGVKHLTALDIDGLIVITPRTEAVAQVRQAFTHIPVVTVDSMYRLDELSVSVDNFQAGQIATDYLIGLGHTSILHIAGPSSWFEATARAAGYAASMRAHRLSPRIIDGDWSAASGYEIGVTLTLDTYQTTAILAANDELCMGLLRAFADRGISVPDQVSVMGFDDVPHAAYLTPPLTTMRLDFHELGHRAFKVLIDRSTENQKTATEPITAALVVRQSTAPPPTA
jgi:DNA-binding LacI/PurR family transcriptional regulator